MKDLHILCASVFLRLMGYGLTNQVLTLHLELLGVTPAMIGWFMTLTLLGDTVISYFLTWNADRWGRRRVMLFGALMMYLAGLVFVLSGRFWVLLLAATVGVISPSGDETGPFKSVEESCIAHLVSSERRAETFAYYGLSATAGGALGSLVAGFVVDGMVERGYTEISSYRAVFAIYTAIAVVKFGCMCCLSEECEKQDEPRDLPERETLDGNSEREPLIDGNTEIEPLDGNTEIEPLIDSGFLSPTSRYLLPRFLAIFMMDSLGYGLMPAGWIVYYLHTRFESSPSAIGTLFFVNNSINAVSSIPSAVLAKVLGPVRAILFTQVPSAFFMAAVPLFSTLGGAAAMLILYYTTATMDVVPRQIMLVELVPKHELTRVMGVVNIGKTLARSVGPVFTGRLAMGGRLGVAFGLNGGCVVVADILLWWWFAQRAAQ